MNRVRVSTLVLAFTLISSSTPVSAVTITFTEIVSFINFTEIPRDVSVGVDVAACPAPETVATAPSCVRRTLTNPEFGFVELSVPPDTFTDARESNPARALLLESDGKTISDRVTLFVVPAVPTGAPRDTVNVQFDSDPIEGSLGAPPNGLLFSATETTGAEVDLTSKFFTGTGTNRTDQYSLPQGFSIKATSDVDASVSEPMTLTLVASGVAAVGAATWTRHGRSAPPARHGSRRVFLRNPRGAIAQIARASCSAAGRGSSGRARRSATSKRFLSSATRLFTGSVVARSGYGRR
jgi:hypothetical protein